jgi:hypothetical protein
MDLIVDGMQAFRVDRKGGTSIACGPKGRTSPHNVVSSTPRHERDSNSQL